MFSTTTDILQECAQIKKVVICPFTSKNNKTWTNKTLQNKCQAVDPGFLSAIA